MSTIRKQHRFATIPEELIFDSSISCGARTLYAILDRHADRDGEAYPGMRRICTMLGVSIDTARGYRSELEASGWLLNQGQNRTDGLMTTNRYLLMQVREGAKNLVPENAATEDYRNGEVPVRKNPGPNDSTFSNESPLGNERLSAAADAPKKTKLRNLSWEALARIGKHDPSKQPTKFFNGMVGTCLKQLRDVEADLDDDDLAIEIERRAAAYRSEWGDERLTPGALVKHWSRFGSAKPHPPERIANVFVPSNGLLPGETQRDAEIRRQKGRVTFIRAKLATMVPGTTQHAQESERLRREESKLNEMEAA